MKEAYYFSHDSNANRDPKILAVRAEFGMEGYGVYWGIIEALREQEDYSIDESLIMGVFANFGIENTKVIQMYNKFLELKLLVIQDKKVYSESLCRRMQKKEKISEKRKEAIKKRWENNAKESEKKESKYKSNTNVLQNDTKESKGNEIKRNNNIDISILNEGEKKETVDNSKLSEIDKNTVQRLIQKVDGKENDFSCFCSIAYQLGVNSLERFVGLAMEDEKIKNKPAYVMGIAKNAGYKIL